MLFRSVLLGQNVRFLLNLRSSDVSSCEAEDRGTHDVEAGLVVGRMSECAYAPCRGGERVPVPCALCAWYGPLEDRLADELLRCEGERGQLSLSEMGATGSYALGQTCGRSTDARHCLIERA